MTHFLNFNYTKVVEQYFVGFAYQKQINYIHGKLNDSINTVNFGFGDEMDDDYKMIENIDDNEYLRNFKSFQYLQNPNYKNLLDFVESDQKFQVYVMGHSCGLSDRTMLNTIFEHPNCISIKIFYHQKKDGNDNYTEIIQNISRHFNKKKLMREKIVNKTLCQPLPQIQLPLK
ncbi:MAG: AbiH family protein [bacterium]|nr:AbiH family protein [bacterium]